MKIEINSAILEKSFSNLETKLELSKGLVDFSQIDICDGNYVPSKTFLSRSNIDNVKKLQQITQDKNIELDMMVDWAIAHKERTFFQKLFKKSEIIDWITILQILRPKRVVLHHSSVSNKILNKIFTTFAKQNIEFGIGIHLDDDREMLVARLSTYPFTYVQIMGIEKVGYGGQSQSEKLIPYIQSFRTEYPNIPISVDGGVKLENIKALKDAGVTRMTIGSGLFKVDDIKKRMTDLRSEVS